MLVCDGLECGGGGRLQGLESPIGTQSPGEGSALTGGTAVAAERDRGGASEHAQNAAQILFHTGTGAAAVWGRKKRKKKEKRTCQRSNLNLHWHT